MSPARAGAAGSTTGFLAAPTEQLGVPGMPASGEITPEGDLYTGWAEYEWSYGERLMPWRQPTSTQPEPGVPLYTSVLEEGSVHYRQSAFAVAVAGMPVVYETITVLNTSDRPRQARVAMAVAYTRGPLVRGTRGALTGAYRFERPVTGQPPGLYEQPGEAFSPSFAYTVHGRDLERSGLLVARGPADASASLAQVPGDGQGTPHGGRSYSLRLPPHAHAALTWQIPLSPPAAGSAADAALDALSLPAARATLSRLWAREEAGMMSIEVPEARVEAVYRAAVAQILDSRYLGPAGWVQTVNRLQYQAFWIRDAAMEIQALDLAGLHEAAAQDLAFMDDAFQQPSGLFISRPGQYDGLGQALWVLARHAQLTRDPAFATAQLPRIQAALGWLSQARAADPLGLLPPGEPGDDELAAGHITGDDLWTAAGLRGAVADATLAGRPALAASWQMLSQSFEAALDRALDTAVARAGHIPPVLDSAGGQDWGNYYAAYPVQVLAASSPAVSATLAWERAHSVQGLPTYDEGRSLHDYLGFPIFQTELERGERTRALAGLYSELAHTTASDEGWEWDVPPFGYRGSDVDMAPHGTFAADYVALLREMLVQEEASGAIVLLDGASPAWQAPGERIAVAAAPTQAGIVSFSERARRDGETLAWHARLAAGTTLQWRLPWWAREARIAGRPVRGSLLTLHGDAGMLSVTFEGRRPAQSYAAEVRALDREYRARGHRAPLVASEP